MVQVSCSRYTPGVTGDEVLFVKGEIVSYRRRDGTVVDVRIDSKIMRHKDCPRLGYEVVEVATGDRYFANAHTFVAWKGKVEEGEEGLLDAYLDGRASRH